MPIYEYVCEACGRILEVMQRFSEPPPKACPECGARKMAKLVSRTAFQLKGGGWYADLYSSRGKGNAEGPAKDAGKGASPDAAKSPAATPATKAASGAAAGPAKPAGKGRAS